MTEIALAGRARVPRSRLSISSISMPDEPFASEVERIARHGLGGVGIWEYKIEDDDIARVKRRLDGHGLRATNCVPIGNTIYPGRSYPTPVDPRDRVEALRGRLARLAVLEPETIVAVTGPMGDEDPERFRETCRWACGVLEQTARDEGVVVALEPVRPFGPADDCPVPTLAAALALLEGLRPGSIGVLVDSWHVAPDPLLSELIVRHPDRIVGAHLADQRPGALSGYDRAFPGEGSGESLALLVALAEIGFDGSLDMEVFSDDGRHGVRVEPCLWELDLDEFVERCAAFADAPAARPNGS